MAESQNSQHQATHRARQRGKLDQLLADMAEIKDALRKAGVLGLRKGEEPGAPPVLPPGKSTPATSDTISHGSSELRSGLAEAPAGLLDMDAGPPGEVARCQACRTPYLYVPAEPWECCGARDFVEDSLGPDELAVAVPV